MGEEVCVIFRIKRTNAGKQQWDDKQQRLVYIKRYEIKPMMRLPTKDNISEHGAACFCEECCLWRAAQP